MPAESLVTVGIPAPPGFPWESYEAVHEATRQSPMSCAKREHAGGWNAVPFRFREATEHDVEFRRLIALRPERNWSAEEQYQISKALLGFFASGVSTFESLYYGMYGAVAMAGLCGFKIEEVVDRRRIDIGRENQRALFPDGSFRRALEELVASDGYRQWGTVRNILSHRQVPNLTHTVWFGSVHRTAEVGWRGSDTGENLEYVPELTSERMTWLAAEVGKLMYAAVEFVEFIRERFPQPV